MSDLSNMDYLRKAAPSIFAERAYNEMSAKYTFIPTSDVVEALGKEGFFPAKVMENRVRLEGKRGFAKHLIRFRNSDILPQIGGLVPEIVLTNSHDGTSSFQLNAGMYRLVCSNGLTVGSDLISVRQRHSGHLDNVIEGVYSVVKDFPVIADTITRWQAINLTVDQQVAFAKAALPLRWDANPDGDYPVHPSHLLTPMRQADVGNDLWRTFNRVQEHVIKGGVQGVGSTGRRIHSRAVRSVNEDQRLNKSLWLLAAELAASV